MPVQRIVVMGVAGSGKTTIGRALADALGARFADGDDFHPAANVAKMAAGTPLTDDDRWPWLARIREELRGSPAIVIACSALARRYRDLLRHADGVRFVLLDVDATTATERAAGRAMHFMAPTMIASQFEVFERPAADETDVAIVDAVARPDEVVVAAMRGLGAVRAGSGVAPLLVAGDAGAELDGEPLEGLIDELSRWISAQPACRRVLLVPPDQTRLHSRAGTVAAGLLRRLSVAGLTVAILPALGTHAPMTDADAAALFGPGLGAAQLLRHDWRRGLRDLGRIDASETAVVSGGAFDEPIPVAVDEQLFAGWDLVVSIGQVVPHEVIGMANFTKNVVIGLGGAPTIHRSHFVGAVVGMERIMGRTGSAVRDLVDAAFDRFVAPAVRTLFVLTVVEDVGTSTVLRGLFAGDGGSMASAGSAFRAAADLARAVNLDVVDEPFERVACWLDPVEFRSTWLGNKAIYRTRMAIADGGELLVLAPGVHRFGEDDAIDALIRRYGYRGTPATLDAVGAGGDLAANLAAAAHLVHGSSEGRFRIVYCTDPAAGGLTEAEVRSVGYEWRHLADMQRLLGIDGTTTSGPAIDADGRPFEFIANPALGLWTTRARFT